jgi:hypothetical protein
MRVCSNMVCEALLNMRCGLIASRRREQLLLADTAQISCLEKDKLGIADSE